MITMLQSIEDHINGLFHEIRNGLALGEKELHSLLDRVRGFKRELLSAPEPVTTTAPAAPAPAAAPAAPDVLLGTSRAYAWVQFGDYEVALGDVVAAAHATSGLTVQEWNDLSEADRDAKIDAFTDQTRADSDAGVSRFPNAQKINQLGVDAPSESVADASAVSAAS